MNQGNPVRKMAAIAVLGIAASVLAACAGEEAISKADFEALQAQISAKDQQVKTKDEQLAAKEKEVAELQKKGTGVSMLLGAKAVPTPIPAPPPTPAPPGAPPPAKLMPPQAFYQPVGDFYFYAEALTAGGVSKFGLEETIACTATSVFKRGSKVAWRFEVIDMSTGKRVSDEEVSKISLSIPGLDPVTPRFGQRGSGKVPDAPWMWMAGWTVPTDYPLGALDYSITLTAKDGRSGSFKVPHLVDTPAGQPPIDNVGMLIVD